MNPPSPTPPQCILISRAVDIGGMRGCHRKLWENVMEVIVKIEKTNALRNTKAVGELGPRDNTQET